MKVWAGMCTVSAMESSIRAVTAEPTVDWTPRREALDPGAFDCGRVGPYALGPEVRCGPFGAVHLALGAQFDRVLELERVDLGDVLGLAWDDPFDGTGARLLDRLNHCVGLRHPHVAGLLGAGLDGGAPYVLRGHVLGRTLGELELDGIEPPPDVAAGIVFGMAEGLGFLAEAGPRPGVCSLGGVDAHAVHLGWDGGIRILGAGYALLRMRDVDCARACVQADMQSLARISARMVPELGNLVEGAADFGEARRAVGRWRGNACAERQARTAAWLREVDAEGCTAYRQFFGLDALN